MTRTGHHEEDTTMTTPTTPQALPTPTAAAPRSIAPFPAPTVPATPSGRARRRSPRHVAVLAAGLGALVATAAACGGTSSGSVFGPGRNHGTTVTTAPAGNGGDASAARLRISQSRSGTTQALGTGTTESGHDLATSGRVNPNYTMADFLTEVVNDVDGMWTNRLAESGDQPQVRFRWMAPGESVTTTCTPKGTGDKTAEYCPADDTIYFSQQMAIDLWKGTFTGSGGVSQRDGGDFAVAVAVAHEFGHNLQAELGLKGTTVQLEDHADCVAGVWANAAYYEGILEPGDAEEAVDVMQAIGSRQGSDHGTPDERVQAYQLGWNNGDLDTCTATYLGA
jgi:predicted metalloprotease